MKNKTTIIINGANWVGAKLVEVLLEQKGNVVVVDDYIEKNQVFIERFIHDRRFVFIEKSKLHTLRENFSYIHYIIHLKNDLDLSDDTLSSRFFLSETKFVDDVLSIAVEKGSVYLLTSSIHLHKKHFLKRNAIHDTGKGAYCESDIQDYIEKMVLEYVKKAGLNGRIARLGIVYGPEMEISQHSLLEQVLTDAFYQDEIKIYGDGLDHQYYVYITDALQGILKALFFPESVGNVYSITSNEEISTLSIVNKVLALRPRAQKIKFLKQKETTDPLYEIVYTPDDRLHDIGWRPSISFDRGIALLFEYFKKDFEPKNFLNTVPKREVKEKKTQDDESLRIDFKNVLNCSIREFQRDANAILEARQFNDFYQKLHRDDSPLYNSKKKRRSTDYVKGKRKSPAKAISVVFVLFVLYIFLIAPFFRVVLLIWNINTSSEKLNVFVASEYRGEFEKRDLGSSARLNFAGLRWAIESLKQDEYQESIISVADGIDSAAQAAKTISDEGLETYINSEAQIPESSIMKVQDVLVFLNTAKTHLDAADKVNLPFGTAEKVGEVRKWTYEMEKDLTKKMQV